MGWLARAGATTPADIRTAMILGSVLASFSVEDFSLDRFRTLDLADIRERFAAFVDLVHFERSASSFNLSRSPVPQMASQPRRYSSVAIWAGPSLVGRVRGARIGQLGLDVVNEGDVLAGGEAQDLTVDGSSLLEGADGPELHLGGSGPPPEDPVALGVLRPVEHQRDIAWLGLLVAVAAPLLHE